LAGLLADYTGFIELLDATNVPSLITVGYWRFEPFFHGGRFFLMVQIGRRGQK
jgi:hypothetical protein